MKCRTRITSDTLRCGNFPPELVTLATLRLHQQISPPLYRAVQSCTMSQDPQEGTYYCRALQDCTVPLNFLSVL